MIVHKNKFYVIRSLENCILVNDYPKKALPIIWNRGGEYRVIPEAVVQNAIDNVEECSKFYSDKHLPPQVAIWWTQGVLMNNQAGRVLTGE